MDTRERFLKVMGWEKADRTPNMDFGYWDETLTRWKKEGLPKNLNSSEEVEESLGLEGYERIPALPVINGLFPPYKEKILHDEGNRLILQNREGNVCEVLKTSVSIPTYLSFGLKTKKDWERIKAERLDWNDPGRIGDVEQAVKSARHSGLPIRFKAGSLYGWLRNWMGLENFSLALVTERRWVEEMLDHLTEMTLNLIQTVFSRVKPDMACWWEDMCYKQGPLLSPHHFSQLMVPRYKEITRAMTRHGVDLNLLDCDGRIYDLVPGWIQAGINCMFPVEALHTDPIKLREQFQVLMIGGVDKNALIRGKNAIDREMEKLHPLVREGGYIPTVDHRVPPDVSYENYLYYLERKKEIL